MNLRDEIVKEHSKAQCNYIVAWVGDSQHRFDELFALFLSDENKINQRAAWAVSYCVEAHPLLINKHFKTFVKNLQRPHLPDAVKRNSLRLLTFVNIPVKYQGEIMTSCFNYLASPAEAVAIQVYSMYVLAKLSRVYPEIIPELICIIEDQRKDQTPALKSCAKNIMQQFSKNRKP